MDLIERAIMETAIMETVSNVYRAKLGLSHSDPVLLKDVADMGEVRVAPTAGIRIIKITRPNGTTAYDVTITWYNGNRVRLCNGVIPGSDLAQVWHALAVVFQEDPSGNLYKVFTLCVNVTEDVLANSAKVLEDIQCRYTTVFHTTMPECLITLTSMEIPDAFEHSDAIAYYSDNGEFIFTPVHPVNGIVKGMWNTRDLMHFVGLR